MKSTLLTLLCSLLCCLFLIPGAYAEGNRGGKKKPDAIACPCPCDQQQVAQWLHGQLRDLANEIGPLGEEGQKIAKKIRDIGDDFRDGKIGLEGVIAGLEEQVQQLEELKQKLHDDANDAINDKDLTGKRLKSIIDEINRKLDVINRVLDGVTNRKGDKVKAGLKDLIECLKKCQNPEGR